MTDDREFIIEGNRRSGDVTIKATVGALDELRDAIDEARERGIAVRPMRPGKMVVQVLLIETASSYPTEETEGEARS